MYKIIHYVNINDKETLMFQPGDAEAIALAVFNTIISGAFGAIITVLGRLLTGWIHVNEDGERYGKMKWSLLSTINGGLSGMVGPLAIKRDMRF